MKKIILIALAMAFLLTDGLTQSRLLIGGGYFRGAQSRTLQVWKDEVTEYKANGYTATAEYRREFTPIKTSAYLELGAKWVFSEGRTEVDAFKNETTKLIIGLGGYYQLISKWSAGLGLQIENNRDFEVFRSQTSDLFRSNLIIRTEFEILPNTLITAAYLRVLSPNVDYYLLTNPSDQFSIGFKYRLL